MTLNRLRSATRVASGLFVVDGVEVKLGRIYRVFGLYNEKLDQIPTFIGIEPPELFDQDHLFLPRTTTFMIHGNIKTSFGNLFYSLDTGNSEAGASDAIPLGADLRLKTKSLIIGTSCFLSSITDKKTNSSVDFHSGPPKGGVLPWMDSDYYYVLGAFLETQIGKFLIQSEFWNANHDAVRNAENVLTLVKEAGINNFQRENFLGNNASKRNDQLTVDDVVTNVDYTVRTFYFRVGYNIKTKHGEFIPYLIFDWMSHPEAIKNKQYGGDNEAGMADDGKFIKPSIGVVYRPIKAVAIKLDVSSHIQKFNGKTEQYPELRMDISFAFK